MRVQRWVNGVEVAVPLPRRRVHRPVVTRRSLAEQMRKPDPCALVSSALPSWATHEFVAETAPDGGVVVHAIAVRSRWRGEAKVTKQQVAQAEARGPEALAKLVGDACRAAALGR